MQRIDNTFIHRNYSYSGDVERQSVWLLLITWALLRKLEIWGSLGDTILTHLVNHIRCSSCFLEDFFSMGCLVLVDEIVRCASITILRFDVMPRIELRIYEKMFVLYSCRNWLQMSIFLFKFRSLDNLYFLYIVRTLI